MEPRLGYAKYARPALKAMIALSEAAAESGLEPSLLELVKIRASQINGCAYCLDLHTKDARAAGETEQRIYALNVWEETPFFTRRERAALAWTEAVTDLTRGHVPDAVFEQARQQFDDEELVNLNWAVIAINGWNRVAISFRAVPGKYEPSHRPAMAEAAAKL